MNKIFAILLIISVFLFPSCASPTSPIDVPPVDGEHYDWAYVKAYANYEIKFYGSENTKVYYTSGVSYYGGNVKTVDGYFQFFPLRPLPFEYSETNIAIGGNWEVTQLD